MHKKYFVHLPIVIREPKQWKEKLLSALLTVFILLFYVGAILEYNVLLYVSPILAAIAIIILIVFYREKKVKIDGKMQLTLDKITIVKKVDDKTKMFLVIERDAIQSIQFYYDNYEGEFFHPVLMRPHLSDYSNGRKNYLIINEGVIHQFEVKLTKQTVSLTLQILKKWQNEGINVVITRKPFKKKRFSL